MSKFYPHALHRAVSVLMGGLLALLMVTSDPAQAETRMIADEAALRAALAEGVAGDTLLLAPGRYGPLDLNGRQGRVPAVIRSADPENPARIMGLRVRNFENLLIEHVVLDYEFAEGHRNTYRPFFLSACSGLVLRETRIEGDLAHGVGAGGDGFPTGLGLRVEHCDDVLIENVYAALFWKGLSIVRSSNVIIRGNEVTQMRADGMNFVQVDTILIEDNYIHDFFHAPGSDDHMDMIQFWTARTEQPSQNITIRNNLLHSWDGRFTQSIFMRNELVDRGEAGLEMFYRNVTIEENVIINAHLAGISIGETDGLVIRRNTLAQNPLSVGPRAPILYIPRINVNEASRNVVIEGNLTSEIRGVTQDGGWSVSGNLFVQPNSSLAPGFYGRVFAGMPGGDPRDVSNFYYRPDGEAADPTLGAAFLRR